MKLDLSELLTAEEHEPEWVVENSIPAGTVVIVAGDAGVGKSVMNLGEGLHVALGRPFLGLKTVQRRVLYFDEENSRPDLGAYIHRLWVGMGQPDLAELGKFFQLEHFSLGSKDWYQRLEIIAHAYNPGMIYFDTATSAFAISEENDNGLAQAICAKMQHLIRALPGQPAIKILKHAKYESGGGQKGKPRRTIRGAKAWRSAADQMQFHIRERGAPRKNGLSPTILVPDKTRAFGLRGNIRIMPSYTDTVPKGLILEGESLHTSIDLMLVDEGE